jgi:hypothetical protein
VGLEGGEGEVEGEIEDVAGGRVSSPSRLGLLLNEPFGHRLGLRLESSGL